MNNWEDKFGTPKKAANTLIEYTLAIDEMIENKTGTRICNYVDSCNDCPIQVMFCNNVLKWLQEEAE